MVNIILADDHKIVRQGLKALLSTEPDFNVVGEAENGLEALKMVDALKPDILILDLTMPVLNGLEVTRSLNHQAGSPRVIILSMHSCEAYVNETLRSGAQAYVLKESSPEDLITAIRQVSAGYRFVSASLSFEPKEDLTNGEDPSQTGPSSSPMGPEDEHRKVSNSQLSRNRPKFGKHNASHTNLPKQLYA